MASWSPLVAGCMANATTPWTPTQWADKAFVISVCGPLQPNADVAGIGVIIAFVGTCVITIVASLFKAFFLGIVSRQDNGFRGCLMPGGKPKWKWMTEHRAIFWNDILGKLIIGLADQQMVTGFAILVAAFHNKSKLTAYHFFVVSTIAAFSCLTQSIALLVLFDIIHRSLFLHTFRVVVYTVVLGMFYYAAFSSHDLTGPSGYKAMCPAECYFGDSHVHYIEIIFGGFPVYAFIILDLVRKYCHTRDWLETIHEGDEHELKYKDLKGLSKVRSWLWWNGFQFLRVFAWVYCVGELGGSFWSVIHATRLQNYIPGGLSVGDNFDENKWGFGQLTAVILIALPFMSVVNEWREKLHEEKRAKKGEIPYAGFPGRDMGGIHRQGTDNRKSRRRYFARPDVAAVTVPDPAQPNGNFAYLVAEPNSIQMQETGENGRSRPPNPVAQNLSPSPGRGSYSPSPVRGNNHETANRDNPDRVRRKPLAGQRGA